MIYGAIWFLMSGGGVWCVAWNDMVSFGISWSVMENGSRGVIYDVILY